MGEYFNALNPLLPSILPIAEVSSCWDQKQTFTIERELCQIRMIEAETYTYADLLQCVQRYIRTSFAYFERHRYYTVESTIRIYHVCELEICVTGSPADTENRMMQLIIATYICNSTNTTRSTYLLHTNRANRVQRSMSEREIYVYYTYIYNVSCLRVQYTSSPYHCRDRTPSFHDAVCLSKSSCLRSAKR